MKCASSLLVIACACAWSCADDPKTIQSQSLDSGGSVKTTGIKPTDSDTNVPETLSPEPQTTSDIETNPTEVSNTTDSSAFDVVIRSETSNAPETNDDTKSPPVECGVWTTIPEENATNADFPWNIQSGAIRAKAATVWARTATPGEVIARYSAGPNCPEKATAPTVTTVESGLVAHIRLNNLTPNTLYRYRMERVGGNGPTSAGWFLTAPDSAETPFRLAYSGDIHSNPAYHVLFDDLIASTADAFLSLGDWPYADVGSVATTIEQYRKKHEEVHQNTDLMTLLRLMPVFGNWDDHEIVNDWDGWHTKTQSKRVKAGMKAWKEWFPHIAAKPGEIYRRYQYGPAVELFQLDCRSHRDANSSPNDASKTMLGKVQLDWLLNALSDSKATFKLIVTSVPLDYGTTGADHWPGFIYERDTILNHITGQKITGVIFLTADQHWLAVHHFQNGIKEFQTGPLATSTRTPDENVPVWVPVQIEELNFGLLDYAPGPPQTLTFSAIGNNGFLLYKETVQAGAGTIQVAPSESQAAWTISGAHTFSGKGSESFSMAPPGEYTISWHSLNGMPAPLSETLTLAPDQVINFEGDYEAAKNSATFVENFGQASLKNNWEIVEQGVQDKTSDWTIKNGYAVEQGNCYDENTNQNVIEKRGTFIKSKNALFSAGTLSAEIYAGDNDGIGLMYSIQNNGSYYRVSVDHERSFARIVRVDDDKFTVLAEDLNYVPPLKKWIKISVTRVGKTHQFLVNDKPVLIAEDNTYPTGGIGLYAWGMSDARFDNIVIYP